jgi:hypothetical protein
MAKQGQHNNDARDSDKSRGHNNPDKSVTITSGSYKKKETYRDQALAHQDPGKPGQMDKNDWNPDTRDKPSITGGTRARNPRSGRAAAIPTPAGGRAANPG